MEEEKGGDGEEDNWGVVMSPCPDALRSGADGGVR